MKTLMINLAFLAIALISLSGCMDLDFDFSALDFGSGGAWVPDNTWPPTPYTYQASLGFDSLVQDSTSVKIYGRIAYDTMAVVEMFRLEYGVVNSGQYQIDTVYILPDTIRFNTLPDTTSSFGRKEGVYRFQIDVDNLTSMTEYVFCTHLDMIQRKESIYSVACAILHKE